MNKIHRSRPPKSQPIHDLPDLNTTRQKINADQLDFTPTVNDTAQDTALPFSTVHPWGYGGHFLGGILPRKDPHPDKWCTPPPSRNNYAALETREARRGRRKTAAIMERPKLEKLKPSVAVSPPGTWSGVEIVGLKGDPLTNERRKGNCGRNAAARWQNLC